MSHRYVLLVAFLIVNVRYHPKVAVQNHRGDVLRYVPAAFAQSLVDAGTVTAERSAGRTRAVVLAKPASTFAHRIGEPDGGRATGVRFHRWENLPESGTRIVQHHPRCLWLL